MTTLKSALDMLPHLTLAELESIQTRTSYLISMGRSEESREAEVDQIIKEHRRSTGRVDGDSWERPTSALSAFPKGARTWHKDRYWISLISANAEEPGVTGWRMEYDIDESGNRVVPPFRIGSGADAYLMGEMILWTDGSIYEATRDGVVHSPAEYPPDWRFVETPAPPVVPEPEEPEEDEEPGETEPGDETDPDEEPVEDDDPADEESGDDEPEEPVEDEPAGEPGTIDNPFTWSGDAVAYQADQYVTYDGVLYRVQQDHESAAHWTPDAVASLYERQ